MELFFQHIYNNLNETTAALLSLAIILFAGFLMSRLTKLIKLPNVTAYILAGIIIGPSVLGLVKNSVAQGMTFVSDIALAFISFGVGKFFKKDVLKKAGGKAIVIALMESLLAGVVVTFSLKFIFSLSWNFSLLLGAIATCTAPASTVMTINQYRAKGTFVNTLLQVIALDNIICLFIFSIVTAFVSASGSGTISFLSIVLPIVYNLASIALGILFGFILSKIIPHRGQGNKLTFTIALLILMCGLCSMVDISPLLGCMMMGAVYINLTNDRQLYYNINNFTPPIMVLFFVTSGMNLNISALTSAGLIGVAYFLIRIISKYLGSYLGARITKSKPYVYKYLGLAMIPQAGVAIGLAFLAQRLLPVEIGNTFLTVILASSILYEIVGPPIAKLSLFKAGTINRNNLVAIPIKYNYMQPEEYELNSNHVEDIILHLNKSKESRNQNDVSQKLLNIEDKDEILKNTKDSEEIIGILGTNVQNNPQTEIHKDEKN